MPVVKLNNLGDDGVFTPRIMAESPTPKIEVTSKPTIELDIGDDGAIRAPGSFGYSGAMNEEKPEVNEPGLGWSGVKDIFTGESRRTPETEALPEIFGEQNGQTSGLGADMQNMKGFKTFISLLLSLDDEDKQGILEKQMGVQFREDEYGNKIGTYKNKQGKESKLVLNKPGFSGTDVLSFLGDAGLANVASKIGHGVRGLFGLGVRSAALGGAEVARQSYIESEGAPEKTYSDMATGAPGMAVGTEVLTSAIPWGAGKVVNRLKGPAAELAEKAGAKKVSGKISQLGEIIDEKSLAALKEAEKIEEAMPMGIIAAQASEDPYELLAVRAMRSAPSTRRDFQELDKIQNSMMKDRINEFIDSIAKRKPIGTGGRKIQATLNKKVKQLRSSRKVDSAPLYKEAKKDTGTYKFSQTNDFVRNAYKDLDEGDDFYKYLKSFEKRFKPGVSGGKAKNQGMRMAKVISIYDNLGDKTSAAYDAGNFNLYRKLKGLRETLMEEMASKNRYADRARNVWKKYSDQIDALTDKESLTGAALRVSPLKTSQIGKLLFDPENIDIKQLKAFKNIVDDVDPGVFDELISSHFVSRMKSLPPRREDSPIAVMDALFKNTAQTDMFESVLNKEQKKNMTYLRKQLKKISLGREGGSDTVQKRNFFNKMKGKMSGVFVSVVVPTLYTGSPVAMLSGSRQLANSMMESTLDRRLKVLGDALLGENWSSDMARIRKMDPQSPRTARVFAQLLSRVDRTIPKDEKKNKED